MEHVYILHRETIVNRLISQALSSVKIDTVELQTPGELLRLEQLFSPSCILMDFYLPEISGLEAMRQMRLQHRHQPVIFMSTKSDPVLISMALNSGAFGFLKRPFHHIELIELVQQALLQEQRQVRLRQLGLDFNQRVAQLTDREQEILKLLIRDKSAKEVGDLLKISHRTVENTRGRIFEKLSIASSSQLTRHAAIAEVVSAFVKK